MQYKKIKGYNGHYKISDKGIVTTDSWGRVRELKQSEHKGYRRVTLSKNNKRKVFPVHRLVAQAFISNPKNKPFINHKDGNKRNNKVSNLEWVTREENWKHNKEVLGYSAKGKKNNNYGYRRAKLYPSEELRNRLVELGIPRYRHNLAELGEMLPHLSKCWRSRKNKWIAEYAEPLRPDNILNITRTYLDADTEANARAKMVIYLKEKRK